MVNLLSLIRPDLVFNTIWLLSLMFALNFSYLNLPTLTINSPLTKYVIYLCLQYTSIFYLLKYFFNIRNRPKQFINLTNIEINSIYIFKLSRFFISLWGLIFIYSVFLFGGFPLMSLISDNKINYYNFIIPSISGLGNLFRIFGCSLYTIYRLRFFKSRKVIKKIDFLFLFILFSPILLTLSRGDQLLLLLIFLGTVICFSEIKISYVRLIKYFIPIIISVSLIIILFSISGYLRYGADDLVQNFSSNKNTFLEGLSYSSNIEIFSFLTKGFLGLFSFPFVTYLSSPLNNINLQMESYEDFKLSLNILLTIFPSALREFFGSEFIDSSELLVSAFNSSSYLQPYFNSFGLIGSLPFLTVIQIISVYSFFKAWNGSLFHRMFYPIIFACNLLSFFFNYFLILTVLFYPILIAKYLSKIKSSLLLNQSLP